MPREAPPVNTVYTGMLAVSLAAILVGCVVLALELTNDYDWVTEAKGGPVVNLPAKGSPAAAAGPGGMAVAAEPKPAVAANDPAEPAKIPVTFPAPVPLPNPVLAAGPAPAAPAPRPVEATQPVSAPTSSTGITPSPFKIPGGR